MKVNSSGRRGGRRALRWLVPLTVGALALGGPMSAFADNVSNKLDTTVDATAEVMSLNKGGPVGTTQLWVDPTGGDGKSGCNLTGQTTLVVSVVSSNPTVATAAPSQVTFGSCGDLVPLTVTQVGVGSATISLTQQSNNTEGTFDLAPATFTVNVAGPANSAPTVTVDGVTAGAGLRVRRGSDGDVLGDRRRAGLVVFPRHPQRADAGQDRSADRQLHLH